MPKVNAWRERIGKCRGCGGTGLRLMLDLGDLAFTGWFPRPEDAGNVPYGPIEILKCDTCTLVQLAHNFSLPMLYGMNYGYRSGLNESMVRHLRDVVMRARAMRTIMPGDVVVDIGGNDGTLVGNFPEGVKLINIDPTLVKFGKYNRADVVQVAQPFTAEAALRASGGKLAGLVFSIAMFYDLTSPVEFAKQVKSILSPEGLWVCEVACLPMQLANNAFDGFCHEHLEYYSIESLLAVARMAGLRAVDLEVNDVNGGSMRVTFCREEAAQASGVDFAEAIAIERRQAQLHIDATWNEVRERVQQVCEVVRFTLEHLRNTGRKVAGLGASTKGNVLLQVAKVGKDLLPQIGEVNEDKFGCVTPVGEIPIVPEGSVMEQKPDALVVLPWHFSKSMIERHKEYLQSGGALFFPLPTPRWAFWLGEGTTESAQLLN